MRRYFEFSIGEHYHIYNRGVDKRKIFLDKNDYKRFTSLLFLCNSTNKSAPKDIMRSNKNLYKFDRSETLVEIGSYCLMPNHFHILIKEKVPNGITNFMRNISSGYALYFNKKYKRKGHLFEGPFKAKTVVFDEYLKYLFAYINLNPVKLIDKRWKEGGIKDIKKVKKFLEEYTYSSYADLKKIDRQEKNILDLDGFPSYFYTKNSFDTYLKDWLEFKKDIIPH